MTSSEMGKRRWQVGTAAEHHAARSLGGRKRARRLSSRERKEIARMGAIEKHRRWLERQS